MSSTVAPINWIAPWEAASGDLPGQDLPWLVEFRRAALDRFHTLGLPTPRWEAWRYTDLRKVLEQSYSLGRGGTPARGEVEAALARLPGGGRFHRLVFIDGVLVKPLSLLDALPAGVAVLSFEDALREMPELVREHLGQHAPFDEDPFVALSGAFARDGLVVYVPKGVQVARPIEAIWLTTAGSGAIATHGRNLVIAEPESAVTVIQVHHADHANPYLANFTTEIMAGANARVTHVRIQEEGRGACHIAHARISQRRDSHVGSYLVTTGSATSRSDLGFALTEPGASATLHGLFALNGRQKADHVTLVDHAAPHTQSQEFYKGVVDGHSEGSFTGRVLVREHAQKIDAQQQNRNLVLAEDARINTRPQLEIYADDVKCSHGATTGQLDDHALFYLRTRGIDIIRARQLLTRAFAAEIITSIPIPEVQQHLLPVVEDRLCPGHDLEDRS